jgi:hypothetical protein
MDEVKQKLKIFEKIYDDALSPALREASKIGVDLVKTFRLVLAPVQYTAMWQERLDRHLKNALDLVPEENRIAPIESLIVPIAEKLKYHEENNPLSDLYVHLLARAMDKERVNEAHPAFIHIISQLAPAQVKILEIFNEHGKKVIYRDEFYRNLAKQEDAYDFLSKIQPHIKLRIESDHYKYEDIDQPELFMTLIEHLYTLGLICYDNEYFQDPEIRMASAQSEKVTLYPLEITAMGKLFHKACIKKEKAAE